MLLFRWGSDCGNNPYWDDARRHCCRCPPCWLQISASKGKNGAAPFLWPQDASRLWWLCGHELWNRLAHLQEETTCLMACSVLKRSHYNKSLSQAELLILVFPFFSFSLLLCLSAQFSIQALSKSPQPMTIMTMRLEWDTIWPSSTSWMRTACSLTCLPPSWYALSSSTFLQCVHFHCDFKRHLHMFNFELFCPCPRAWSVLRLGRRCCRLSWIEASSKKSKTTPWWYPSAGTARFRVYVSWSQMILFWICSSHF